MNNTSGIIFLSDDSGGENEIALTDKQQLHIEEIPSTFNTKNSDIFNFSINQKTPTTPQHLNNNNSINNISPPPPLYFGAEDDFLYSNDLSPINNLQPSTSSQNSNNSSKRSLINKEDKNEFLSENCEVNNEKNVGEEEEAQPVAKKRKKRTKEEIEAEKLQKEVIRVQREMQSAKNTKCEQYLFCYFSNRILTINDNLREELNTRFNERGIPNQLIYENSTGNLMRITWRRKRIEACIDQGKLNKSENMELQSWFCCVLSAETFTVLAKTKEGVINFIKEQTVAHKKQSKEDVRLKLIVLGKHSIRENILSSLIFEAYERYRAQIRMVPDVLDFSFLVVQMHRALAKAEKKSDKLAMAELVGIASNHFAVSKGISEGPGMVTDWWTRMLEHVPRLSEEQRRAIIKEHPNPIKLMSNLMDLTNSPGNSMFRLSEIKGESGRRLGPVMAQRIYKILTSMEGEEIIDLGTN
uniref:ERCC4 domain-containing protein n=1 Tax=Meloidogyne incognita TaxID=6306 RepID=A0A914M390_MELIC